MTSTKLSRLSSALAISASALILCGSQLSAQTLDQRKPLDVAARIAAARRLAGRAVSSPMAPAAGTLTEAQGTFITFDAPGAGNVAFSGTYSVSINPAGEILGSTIDSSGAETGFLRSSQGTFATFNVSGAATGYSYPFSGVGPSGSTLNPSGEATGSYGDANFALHGFVGTTTALPQRSMPLELT